MPSPVAALPAAVTASGVKPPLSPFPDHDTAAAAAGGAPILRQLITRVLPPTSSPSPPQPPAAAPVPASRTKDSSASAASPPPSAPSAPAVFPYTFSLPYWPHPSCLLSRFVLSRLDDEKRDSKDAAKKKPVTASSLPPPTPAAANHGVALQLSVPHAAVLLCVYSYTEWQQTQQRTQSFLTISNDLPAMEPLHSALAEGEAAMAGLQLSRERPLLVEVWADPLHLGPVLQDYHDSQREKRQQPSPVNAAAPLPAASPSAKKAKVKDDKKQPPSAAEEERADDRLCLQLTVTAASPTPLSLSLDITAEERRRERRAQWEKSEPGRARRGKALRDAFLTARAEEEKDNNSSPHCRHPMLLDGPLASAEEETLLSAADWQRDCKEAEAAEQKLDAFRQCLRELRRAQSQLLDEWETKQCSDYTAYRQAEQQHWQLESSQRDSLRQLQQSEQQAIDTVIATLKARSDQLLHPAQPTADTSHPDLKSPKKGKAKPTAADAVPPPVKRSELELRHDFIVKLQSEFSHLLDVVAPARRWRIESLILTVRRQQWAECRLELTATTERVTSIFQPENDHFDDDTVETETAAEAVSAKPSKDSKAEKEKRDQDRRLRLSQAQQRRTDRLEALQAFRAAVGLHEQTTGIIGEKDEDLQQLSTRFHSQSQGAVRDFMLRLVDISTPVLLVRQQYAEQLLSWLDDTEEESRAVKEKSAAVISDWAKILAEEQKEKEAQAAAAAAAAAVTTGKGKGAKGGK